MIEKTRRKFILLATSALSCAMILVVTAINLANLIGVRNELNETLDFLVRFSSPPPVEWKDNRGGQSRRHLALLSESRYFIVNYDGDGTAHLNNQLHDESYSKEGLLALAQQAVDTGEESGKINSFIWAAVHRQDSPNAVVFLNTESKTRQLIRLLQFSLFACLIGIAAAALIVYLYSGRIIQPMINNVQRMKRFITDASHELKTPLTVISANMDVLSLDQPDNTWIHSTQKQTANLRRMVDEMLYLTRVEEEDAPLNMQRINLSALLADASDPFVAMAEFSGRSMTVQAERNLTVIGDESALRRLITILLDNAVKYAPDSASISVTCQARGRHIDLQTVNAVETPLTQQQCAQLFDRFYRVDESRDKSERSGYGIGLAIASAIAGKHSGRMDAHMQDDALVIRCVLPAA